MRDGCDEVTIKHGFVTMSSLIVTSSPSTQAVTASEGHGNRFERVPVRGVVRRQQGSARSPSESPRHLCSRIAESVIVGYYTSAEVPPPKSLLNTIYQITGGNADGKRGRYSPYHRKKRKNDC